MANIPQKVADRLIAGIKRFQPILTTAQTRDVNEADTVTIIKDMVSEIFGYDKYSEVTAEKAIRGTFCDLAIKVDGAIQSLIEAKAINQELKDGFVKQAVDYAANEPVDWVVLTNGIIWRIYKVTFSKPIDHDLIVEFNFLTLSHHNPADLEMLFLLTRESWVKSALVDYYEQKQALSRFSISAVILTDPVLTIIKRELKRISPEVKIDADQIRVVLEQEVLKREVVEGEKADEARKRIARAVSKANRNKAEKTVGNTSLPAPEQALPPQVALPTTAPASVTIPPS
jgi:hypothetical protein